MRSLLKILIATIAIALCASSPVRANMVDATVLGLRLGITVDDARVVLNALKADLPYGDTYTAADPAGGPNYVVGLQARSANGLDSVYAQFSPPFDGQRLTAIERSETFSMPDLPSGEGKPAPMITATENALFSHYGKDPLVTYPFGKLILWTDEPRALPDDEMLRRCWYQNQRPGNVLINRAKGCGLTLQVTININSQHPSLVFQMRFDLVDQDHLAQLNVSSKDVADQLQAKRARSRPGSPPPF